ncbi:TadE family protein [Virgisporangium aurantiacum]|nr:TadE family protein [Virgisporangium aurantiacum]
MRHRRIRRADRGSVSVEMAVIVLPLAAVMAVFAIFCTRLAVVRLDLNAAAAAAARAASMARTPQAATAAAVEAAHQNLAGHRRTCDPLEVAVDGTDYRRGGRIAVTITCRMSTAGLTGLGLPGTLTGSATAHAVIDTHRAVSLGSTGSRGRSGPS